MGSEMCIRDSYGKSDFGVACGNGGNFARQSAHSNDVFVIGSKGDIVGLGRKDVRN